MVDPEHRRRGHGSALLHALEQSAGPELRVWAHGDLPPAAALAAARATSRSASCGRCSARRRSPCRDERPLDGLRLRAFRPGEDEEAWLGVNSRAFAAHPEQGGWTATDLAEREATDWFDPAGLLRRRGDRTGDDGRLPLDQGAPGAEDGEPVGEVYVLAVDPAYQGRGLASALTVAGLRHLAGRGLDDVMLYVDG